MDKSVNTTKVDKYAVRCDVLDNTLKDLAFLEFADDISFLSLKLCLDECFVRNYNVAEFVVDLHDLELHCLVDKNIVITYWFNINL